jgi:ribonuclease HI
VSSSASPFPKPHAARLLSTLEPPLPEGTLRRPRSIHTWIDDDDDVILVEPVLATQQTQEDQTQQTQQTQQTKQTQQKQNRSRRSNEPVAKKQRPEKKKCVCGKENIQEIRFDGAFRRGAPSPGAAAVYCCGYDCPFSTSLLLPSACTSNECEITACSLAIKQSIKCAESTLCSSFVIAGDSAHVIECIRSGRVLSFSAHSRLPNAAWWRELGENLKFAQQSGLSLSFSWRPRRYNAEADELCNACLDKRDCNVSVTSPLASPPSSTLVDECLTLITCFRFPTLRLIPSEITPQWREFLFCLCADDQEPVILRRKLFFLAPHLLSVYTRKVSSRNDFKQLRSHLGLLNQKEYLYECLETLKQKILLVLNEGKNVENYIPKTSLQEREMKRIRTLAARGLFNKIVQTNDILLAQQTPENLEKTRALFPTSPLPEPIPQDPTPVELDLPSLLNAFLSLKRGKAPGLTGWTRELFSPLLSYDMAHPFFSFLLSSFTCILNNELEYNEQNLLKTGSLTLLTYKEQMEKIRPIVVKDVILKVALLSVLKSKTCSIPTIRGSSFGQKGGSATVVALIQQALNNGYIILCCDAKNAFNLCSRKAAFATIKKMLTRLPPNKLKDLIPLLNLIYANTNYALLGKEKIEITTGTSQGCVSGPGFLELCKMQIEQIQEDLNISSASVSDDFYFFIRSLDELDNISTLLDYMKEELGLDLRGPKMKFVSNEMFTPPPSFSSVVITGPAAVLGCVVFPPLSCTLPYAQLFTLTTNCLKKCLGKVEASVSFIKNCTTSKQIKLATLRSIQFSTIYLLACLPDSPVTVPILESLEAKYLELFYFLFAIPVEYQDPSHQVRIQSPIEDGGLGLLPLTFLRPHVFSNNEFETNKLRAKMGIEQIDKAVQSISFKAIWKTFMGKENKVVAYRQGSFLSAWPSKPLLTLDDETCVFGVWHRLHLMTPVKQQCLHTLLPLETLSPDAFCSHIESCLSCGAKFFHTRHEAVNNVLHKTFRYHNICTEINPKDLPLPNNANGGPDFVLFLGSEVFAGDTVITCGRTSEVFARKIVKYREFAEATSFVSFPFAMNTCGQVDYGTLTILQKIQELSSSKRLVNDIVSNAQFELLKGMFCAYKVFKARGQLKYAEQGMPLTFIPPISCISTQTDAQPASKRSRTESITSTGV